MRPSATLLAAFELALGSACNRTPEAKPEKAAAPHAAAQAQAPSALPTAETVSGAYELPGSARVIAIGDLHGDLNALRATLRLAGAIDGDARWIGGKDLTVVQTGDQLDRGDHDREVLDEIERLEGEARRAGSAFYVLNGNHELMNASLDFRYVSARGFSSFDDQKNQAGATAGRVPPAELGRAAAFAPGGPYALKLSKHLTIVRIGDTLFAHGGVLPAHVDYGLGRLNAEASAFLSGRLHELPKALSAEDSPVWTRVYGVPDPDQATCDMLGRALALASAKRMVVGHTVQKEGITGACQERVFRIDVGLSAFYGQNPPQVLEITAQGVRILRAGQSADEDASGKREKRSKGQNAGPALHSAP